MNILPPYSGPGENPSPQISPLTYRDGITLLKKLDWINRWINRELVPFVNDNFKGVADRFTADVNNLINAVNDAVNQVIGNSITVQDPVVKALLENNTSATRVALNAILAGYYTKTETDAKFATIANLNLRYTKTEVDSIVKAVSDRLVIVENAIGTGGYLSQAELDKRYVKTFQNPVAIFIGSSNAGVEPRNWTVDFAAQNGWVHKNYAVGGGGFSKPAQESFYQQAQSAIADTSVNKASVKFFFIIDMSNDTRWKANVQAQADSVFGLVEAAYPNARIIVVPEVWPYSTANSDTDIVRHVSRNYNQVRLAAQKYKRVEVINHTWLWFWDGGAWSEGAQIDVHLNENGYKRLAWYIGQYVNRGIQDANDLQDTTFLVAVSGGMLYARRVGGIVNVYGNLTFGTDQNTAAAVARAPIGFAPHASGIPVVAMRDDNYTTKMLEMASDGAINNHIPIPAGNYYIQLSYAVM